MNDKNPMTADRRQTRSIDFGGEDDLALHRLDELIAANAEVARQKASFRSAREELEAGTMQHPLSPERAYSYLGLLLGTFPPATIFLKYSVDTRWSPDDLWIVLMLATVNIVSAAAGYFSGRLVGKAVREIEKLSWQKMLVSLPIVGLAWGLFAGGIGGMIIFIVGAFFGALAGGLVGAVALPVFAVLHRLLKRGDAIEMDKFFPLAFGLTFTICALILNL